ncbi:hypothetical protein C0J52_19311 [Blattella germanica]|nr:hypothetical protein C0J52_19311 [Blattella germanica]
MYETVYRQLMLYLLECITLEVKNYIVAERYYACLEGSIFTCLRRTHKLSLQGRMKLGYNDFEIRIRSFRNHTRVLITTIIVSFYNILLECNILRILIFERYYIKMLIYLQFFCHIDGGIAWHNEAHPESKFPLLIR